MQIVRRSHTRGVVNASHHSGFLTEEQVKDHCEGSGNEVAKDFEMPDGQVISVGKPRWNAPECLFDPSMIGVEQDGIARLVKTTVDCCDMDVRRDMYENIVLSGGNTLFKKLATRLQKSIDARVQERFAANAVRLGGRVVGVV